MKLRSFRFGFWALHRRQGFVVERAFSNELERPYRRGQGYSVRFLGTRALTVGRWTEKYSEGDPDLWSLSGRDYAATPEEIETW